MKKNYVGMMATNTDSLDYLQGKRMSTRILGMFLSGSAVIRMVFD
jgi:hypothetical protein